VLIHKELGVWQSSRLALEVAHSIAAGVIRLPQSVGEDQDYVLYLVVKYVVVKFLFNLILQDSDFLVCRLEVESRDGKQRLFRLIELQI